MESLTHFIHRIRYRFSRPYRISIGVGLDPLRSKREAKALRKMCAEWLIDREICELNPAKTEVFQAYVDLYDKRKEDVTLEDPNLSRVYKPEGGKKEINKPTYFEYNDLVADFMSWFWT